MLLQSDTLSAYIKGSENVKVCMLEKAIATLARGILLRKEGLEPCQLWCMFSTTMDTL